jgi:hypothetical protein
MLDNNEHSESVSPANPTVEPTIPSLVDKKKWTVLVSERNCNRFTIEAATAEEAEEIARNKYETAEIELDTYNAEVDFDAQEEESHARKIFKR